MRLAKLADGSFKVPARLRDLEVSGLTCDSRDVKPGYLFIALPGSITDGHLFADAAVEAGAVVIVGEKAPGARRAPVPVELRVPVFSVSDSRTTLGKLATRFYAGDARQLTAIGITGGPRARRRPPGSWTRSFVLREGSPRSSAPCTTGSERRFTRAGTPRRPASSFTPR